MPTGYYTEGKVENGVNVGGGTFVPGTPPVITPQDLSGSTTPYNLPPSAPAIPAATPTVTPPSGTTLDDAGNIVPTSVSTPSDGAQPTKLAALFSKLGGLNDLMSTKGDVTKQLQDQNQLGIKTESAAKSYNAYQQAKNDAAMRQQTIGNNPTGMTAAGVAGVASDTARLDNANVANLAIVANADQGLLEAAQKNIQNKLDAQFKPIQEQIDNQEKFLQLNQNDLTDSEKAQMQEKIDKTKKDSADVQGTAEDLHKAVLQNAPNDVKDSIYSAMDKVSNDFISGKIDSSEAQTRMYQAVGPYGVNPLDRQIKQAQYDNIRSEIANRGGSGANGGIDDPAQILGYAQQYASNGQIPPGIPKGAFGIISQTAKELPQQPGAIVDAHTGVKSSKFSATQADAATIMKDLADRADALKETYKSTSIFSPLAQRQKYNDQRNEMVDLLARLRTGAAISETESKAYENKLPKLFGITNPFGANLPSTGNQKIDDFKSSVTGKLDNSLKSNGQVMYGFSKVNLGGTQYNIGDVISVNGKQGRILADGTVVPIQ